MRKGWSLVSGLLLWPVLSFSAGANCAFVACEKGAVIDVIDVSINRVAGELPTAGSPCALAFSEDGTRLYVRLKEGRKRERRVEVFDAGSWENLGTLATKKKERCVYDGETGEKVCFRDKKRAEAGGAVYEVHTKRNRVVKKQKGKKRAFGPVILPTGDSPLSAVTVTPDPADTLTQELWVASGPACADASCSNAPPSEIRVYNTRSDTEVTQVLPVPVPIDITQAPGGPYYRPTDMGVVVESTGASPPTRVYVTMFDSNVVLVYSADPAGKPDFPIYTLIGNIAVGDGPRAIAVQP